MLGAKIEQAAASIGLPWPPRWNLSISEALLFLPTLFMALAFELIGDRFGKQGVPISLPASFGSIPNFQPKLFPMEIFLLFVAFITIAHIRRWPWAQLKHPLVLFTVGILILGFARAIPDLKSNPVLVIRNLAFVWYLALPLMIALYPLESVRWESFFRFLYLLTFFYFAMNLAYPFYLDDARKVWWSIDLGLLLVFAYGMCSDYKWGARLALGSIGIALGLSYFSSIQRTTLVGLLVANLLLFISSFFFSERFPRPRWRRLVWIVIGIGACVVFISVLRAVKVRSVSVIESGVDAISKANPSRASENNNQGLEKFRYYMWLDAWEEFRSSPVVGIGFLKPVVKRAYAGAGKFLENTGSFEQLSLLQNEIKSPPISGPHNSYLNAIARLGIFGVSILILHLTCGLQLLSRCYFACFFVLVWQMLYAFFNVSLEGPIRSFPILVLIGVALRLSIEKSRLAEETRSSLKGPLQKHSFKNSSRSLGNAPLRVGVVHVPYRFVGGEDLYVQMLRARYEALGMKVTNIPAADSPSDLLLSAARSLTVGRVSEWDSIYKSNSIDFIHVNNIHAALGPAFLRWIINRNIPAVMTVHNHRFYCTNGLALYGNEACKACRPKPSLLRPILKNCNSSLPKSIYHSTAMMEIRRSDLLRKAIALFLAPSPYIARELQIAGVPLERIRIFPHAVKLDQISTPPKITPPDVVFVGRISPEKGVMHLVSAARLLPEVTFAIVGEGPLEQELRKAIAKSPNIRFYGKMERPDSLALMKSAKVACVPSVCHESFSLVAAEALSFGLHLVVPDTHSFIHYRETPVNAVTAIVTNPESLAYSISTALELPPRTESETTALRNRFSVQKFQDRLRQIVNEVTT